MKCLEPNFGQQFEYCKKVLEGIKHRFRKLLDESDIKIDNFDQDDLLSYFDLYLLEDDSDNNGYGEAIMMHKNRCRDKRERPECLIRNEFEYQKYSHEKEELQRVLHQCDKTIEELSGKYLDLINQEATVENTLKSEIETIEKKIVNMREACREELKKLHSENSQIIRSEQSSQMRTCEEYSRDLRSQIKANYDKESSISQKNQKLSNEIRIWIDRYDEEMQKSQNIVDDLDSKINRIASEKNSLMNEFQLYESKYLKLMQERKEQCELAKTLAEQRSNEEQYIAIIEKYARRKLIDLRLAKTKKKPRAKSNRKKK